MTRRDIVSRAGAAATLALLLVATPRVFAQEPPKGPEGSHEVLDASVAARFAAMQKLAARFSTPEAAGKLVDVLVARDTAAFNALVGDLDLPLAGTCWWAHDLVETAFAVETEKVCTLEPNMTPEQRRLYIMLALKYHQFDPTVHEPPQSQLFTVEDRVVVPNGPFADALEEAGLAHCEPAKTSNLASVPIVGDPYYFCLQDGPKR